MIVSYPAETVEKFFTEIKNLARGTLICYTVYAFDGSSTVQAANYILKER